MHEYLDLAMKTGYFEDPRVLYDLTPAEISLVIEGRVARDQQLELAKNVRAGSIVAAIYNSLRTKKSDRIWTWKDIFPDTSLKPEQTVEEMKQRCKDITLIFGGEVRSRGAECR